MFCNSKVNINETFRAEYVRIVKRKYSKQQYHRPLFKFIFPTRQLYKSEGLHIMPRGVYLSWLSKLSCIYVIVNYNMSVMLLGVRLTFSETAEFSWFIQIALSEITRIFPPDRPARFVCR